MLGKVLCRKWKYSGSVCRSEQLLNAGRKVLITTSEVVLLFVTYRMVYEMLYDVSGFCYRQRSMVVCSSLLKWLLKLRKPHSPTCTLHAFVESRLRWSLKHFEPLFRVSFLCSARGCAEQMQCTHEMKLWNCLTHLWYVRMYS